MIRDNRLNRFVMSRLTQILILILSFVGMTFGQEARTIDGFSNNIVNPELGTAGSQLSTLTTPSFTDGFSSPAAQDRLNPRIISNMLFAQDGLINDSKSLSDYNWVFGQFIDHDITLVENAGLNEINEMLMIPIPADDKFFEPGTGMFIMRSAVAQGTGTGPDNPRKYENQITHFLDGSGIYGSDEYRASWLRSFQGGKLKVSANNNLPWNTIDGLYNSSIDPAAPFMGDDTHSNDKLYVAGDVRANENPLLLAVHTLFVREHNRLCDDLKAQNPDWNDEQLYQHARRMNIGYLQSITYNEWLPAMGIEVPSYTGYNPEVDPSISNIFSAAAFRMGHTLINSNLIRMNAEGDSLRGTVTLKDAFFNPGLIILSGGVDPFLKGMGTQVQQNLDTKVIDDVRNFLFGAPGAGGLDLAAINITRGRERGLPDYNTVRENFGLPRVRSFSEICSVDPEVANLLELLYGTVNNIDPWVGILAEDHMKDAIFGELAMTIIEKQFRAVRDGDRFFYLNDSALSESEKADISNTTFHDLLMRNTDIKLMQSNVFVAMKHEDIPDGPELSNKVIDAAIFPNPVTPESRIKIHSREDANLTISLFDNSGHRISSEKISMEAGEIVVNANYFSELPKGAYLIKIENEVGLFTVLRAIL